VGEVHCKTVDGHNGTEELELEGEEEVVADQKGLYFLRSEVQKAMQKLGDKKAAGFDVLGEGGLRIVTGLEL
jgi:hypothetical protein